MYRLLLAGLACTSALCVQTPTRSSDEGRKALQAELDAIEKSESPAAGDQEVDWQNPKFRFLDISLNIMVAAGGSTASDAELQDLQGGGHDPRKRGFTLQAAELRFSAAVDPHFDAVGTFVTSLDPIENETVNEIEEAYLVTRNLPNGFDFQAGHMFTKYGDKNWRHAHVWDWLDQPIINSRLFGGDGMRGIGLRVGYGIPASWDSAVHLSVQNSHGETMVSFGGSKEVSKERGVGGQPFVSNEVHSLGDFVYLLRWENVFETSEESRLLASISGLYGNNSTGKDGATWIGGIHADWTWQAAKAKRNSPFFSISTEWSHRSYKTAAFFDPQGPGTGDDISIPSRTLKDWGFYTEALYGFSPGWEVGLRGEYATGSGDNVDPGTGASVSRSTDPFRADRTRISPLLAWRPTEFSRIRLQYNYDDTDSLADKDAHSVWLGFEAMIGSHPAHGY